MLAFALLGAAGPVAPRAAVQFNDRANQRQSCFFAGIPMSNFKPLRPEDLDESIVKLVEFSGRHHVLLPFMDATGAAPECRSLGHATEHRSIRIEDLHALAKAMKGSQQGAAWFILFNTPWLLRQSDADAMQKAEPARR
jgi:hypothetical protein